MTFLARLLSTGFGIGYSPKAPGTMGALVTVVVYWFCPTRSPLFLFSFSFAVIIIGIITSSITEKEFQNKTANYALRDPAIIIIDEIAGMLTALIFIPKKLPFVIIAFLLFRFFDIAKPFPINRVEKLPSGWGIMFDDVIAGIFSNIILQISLLIFN